MYKTLQDVKVKNKTVLVRLDLDSPFIDGKIIDNLRLRESAKTIRYLIDHNAKVVCIGHQSRPGKESFTTLETHAKILSFHVGSPIKYIPSLFDDDAKKAISSLTSGHAILLENTRMFKDELVKASKEELAKTEFVQNLSPLVDLFVQNAFTVAHRAQTSMVGFYKLPSVAGLRFDLEVKSITKASKEADRPYVMILGGAKIDDYFSLIDDALSRGYVDTILTGGLLGDACAIAKGTQIPAKMDFLSKKDSVSGLSIIDLVPKIKKYLDKCPNIFKTPIDFGVKRKEARVDVPINALLDSDIPYDIGILTANMYAEIILEAKTLYLKGPMGMYEDERFALGSKIVVEAISKSNGFSLIGGGDSVTVSEQFADLSTFSHVGLAGGATLKLLSGVPLPALEVLENNS